MTLFLILGCLTKNGEFCLFPFKFMEVSYDECTNVGFGNTMWCATKRTQSGEVTAYGVCSDSCPRTSTIGPDVCGSLEGQRCVFPFVYKGNTYNGCTTLDNSGRPWCATSINPSTKEYVNYGECNKACLVPTPYRPTAASPTPNGPTTSTTPDNVSRKTTLVAKGIRS
eukprot:TRINITY_DN3157_c0_g1_i3.p1 TRINITY_DN3157_c0_g1~~TRINITY_DN3157_c0_g1_i3.p1  ORF type:complete len:187 (+),score=6.56 TRINITY_DN3157_c0_g1_i3:58-561(+)